MTLESGNESFELIYRIICKAEEKWVWEKGQMVLENDNIVALEGFIADITKRKKTETALMQSLMKYEIIFQANPVWITLNTLDEIKYIEANEAFLRDTGYLQEEVVGKTSKYIDTWVDPKIREMIFKQVKETGRIHNMEVQRKNKKGEIINALFSAELLNLEGQKVMISVTQNITTLKKMQEDRDSLNEQLQHSQKMESVGRLAGGVAHDYNNMLTVIIGYAEILLSGIEEDSQEYKRINEILKAANRSANITRQLLVFARKQNIDPKVLDLNVTIDGMLTMLKRLIGENIELIWEPGKDLWQLKMDTSQIDQILVNFCVNSRDAIEYGGQILIRTENFVVDETISERYQGLVQGEYILLTFSDDGKGISKSAIEKIFDPFYTTKPVGKGTGLGLSIIYGIIKQNNGYIDVESIPNEGTTFKIYLPHYKSNGESDYQVSRDNNVESKGETILVVEDDASVRQTIEMMLVGFGYNVLTAKNPKDACDIAKRHSGNIHLLLSDVIMPNLDGRGLAKMITKLIPDIRVLFMSGYTSDSFIREGLFYKGANFIEKPFSSKKLGLKIMEVLEKK